VILAAHTLRHARVRKPGMPIRFGGRSVFGWIAAAWAGVFVTRFELWGRSVHGHGPGGHGEWTLVAVPYGPRSCGGLRS
jgi:hypothetical protein